MVTILPALGQVREDLVALWDRTAVERACRELGYRWRDRRLDPYTTLHLFILQVHRAFSVFACRVHGPLRCMHRGETARTEVRGSLHGERFRTSAPHDQIVAWRKPQQRPKWMTDQQFASLPEELVVREIKVRMHEGGCRVREVTLVTTLLDGERYPAKEIAKLYKLRRQVEVDLRDLKMTLGMDVLKGKKVQTVQKEVLV